MPASSWRTKASRNQTVPPDRTLEPLRVGNQRRRQHIAAILGLWTIALLAYSNSFSAPLIFDNTDIILKDARIQAATVENARLILTGQYWPGSPISALYRPLTTFSYLLNYAVLGSGQKPVAYHWVNFGLHALNIALVYMLGMLLFDEIAVAAAMAALWSVHPVLTESVTNVVGRADLLAGFGVLAGLLCHVRAGKTVGRTRTGWLAATFSAGLVAFFSKESGIVLVAAMVIYDLAYPAARFLRERATGYVALAAPLILFLYTRPDVIHSRARELVFTDNPLLGADFWTARLTAVGVLGRYLALLVWPGTLSGDYSYNQIPLFTWRFDSWSEWVPPISVLVMAALAAAGLIACRRSRPVFFLVFFSLAAIAPTANLALLIGTIMAERFLYLPAIGFAGCVALLISGVGRRVSSKWPHARLASPAALVLICAALAGRTFLRNRDWSGEVRFWESAAAAAPNSYKAHLNFGFAVSDSRPDVGVRELDRALEILRPLPDQNDVVLVYASAGAVYRELADQTHSPEKERFLREKALSILIEGRRVDEAERRYFNRGATAEHSAVQYVGWAPLYLELGSAYLATGLRPEASEAFRQARRMNKSTELLLSVSQAYRRAGLPDEAAVTLLEGLSLDPARVQLAAELAALYNATDPKGCAVMNQGGAESLNLSCPKVQAHVCSAARNIVTEYLADGNSGGAGAFAASAVRDLGCPQELFR